MAANTVVTAVDRAAARRGRLVRVAVGIGGGGMLMGALVGCGSAEAEEAPVERKAFALEGDRLTVDSDNSAVEVVAADVEKVEVSRQIDGWVFVGSGPEASWRMEGERLVLRMGCKGIVSDCSGRQTVKVPRGVAVTVVDENGGVTASGFSTPLKIDSGNGDVTVRDTSGALDLVSDNGTITTERVTAKTVRAVSDNGEVRIGLKAGAVPERVETVSDNGGIRIDLPRAGAPYAVTAESDNGTVDVDPAVGSGGTRVVSARSDNGWVKVRAAD
ncbi:lipoprotein [Streptomyces inusitatus]|uniref:Lipoprotein n=1 Tax=Streptomyces inusitatus TaxID=68221 RepID=A0A918PTM1_9ACTN|nr:lipoprotein [Streptomyces inusitatus]